jgi:hypothetical protein
MMAALCLHSVWWQAANLLIFVRASYLRVGAGGSAVGSAAQPARPSEPISQADYVGIITFPEIAKGVVGSGAMMHADDQLQLRHIER